MTRFGKLIIKMMLCILLGFSLVGLAGCPRDYSDWPIQPGPVLGVQNDNSQVR